MAEKSKKLSVKQCLRAAKAALAEGDYDEVLRLGKIGLKQQKDNKNLWLLCGMACVQSDRYTAAEQHFQRVITIDAESPHAYKGLTEVYVALEKWEELIDAARHLIPLIPKEKTDKLIEVSETLVNAQLKVKRHEEAVESCGRVLVDALIPLLDGTGGSDAQEQCISWWKKVMNIQSSSTVSAGQRIAVCRAALPVLDVALQATQRHRILLPSVSAAFLKCFLAAHAEDGVLSRDVVVLLEKECSRCFDAQPTCAAPLELLCSLQECDQRGLTARLFRRARARLIHQFPSLSTSRAAACLQGLAVAGSPDATTRERFQILRHVASVVSSSGAKSDLPLPFPLPLAVSMARAIEHARKGHSGSAVRVVREALESIKRREKTDAPQYTFSRVKGRFLVQLGYIQLAAQKHRDAILAFKAALKLEANQDAQCGLVRAHIGSHVHLSKPMALDEAEKCCNVILEHSPSHSWALAQRGHVNVLRGEWKHAETDLERSLESMSTAENAKAEPFPFQDHGELLVVPQENLKALSLHWLGMCLWESGKTAEGRTYFLRSAKCDPSIGANFAYLGEYAATEEGNSSRAQKCFERALQLDPLNERAGTAMGDIHERNGNVGSALLIYRNATAQSSAVRWAWRRMGLLQLSEWMKLDGTVSADTISHQIEEALSAFQNVTRLDSSRAHFDDLMWLGLGIAYRRTGKHAAARKALEHLIEQSNTGDVVFEGEWHLAAVESEMGLAKCAASRLKRLVSERPEDVCTRHSLVMVLHALASDLIDEGCAHAAAFIVQDALVEARINCERGAQYHCIWKVRADLEAMLAALPAHARGKQCPADHVELYERARAVTLPSAPTIDALVTFDIAVSNEAYDEAELEKVSQLVQDALEQFPMEWRLWSALSAISVRQCNFKLALHCGIIALEIHTHQQGDGDSECRGRLWSNLALVLMKARPTADGISSTSIGAILAKSFSASPDQPRLHLLRALSQAASGNREEAWVMLQQCLTGETETTQTALWIGALSSSKISESSFRSVVHALQSYVNVYPEHAIARLLLSLSYARQGSWTAAWRHLEAARAHEVPVEIEQAIIAAMLRSAAEKGETEQAGSLAQECVSKSIDATVPGAWRWIGAALSNTNKEKAAEYLSCKDLDEDDAFLASLALSTDAPSQPVVSRQYVADQLREIVVTRNSLYEHMRVALAGHLAVAPSAALIHARYCRAKGDLKGAIRTLVKCMHQFPLHTEVQIALVLLCAQQDTADSRPLNNVTKQLIGSANRARTPETRARLFSFCAIGLACAHKTFGGGISPLQRAVSFAQRSVRMESQSWTNAFVLALVGSEIAVRGCAAKAPTVLRWIDRADDLVVRSAPTESRVALRSRLANLRCETMLAAGELNEHKVSQCMEQARSLSQSPQTEARCALWKACIAHRTGQDRDALTHLRNALKCSGDNLTILRDVSRQYIQMGRLRAAQQVLEYSLSETVSGDRATNVAAKVALSIQLAQLHLHSGSAKEAVKWASSAVGLSGKSNVAASFLKAHALLLSGDAKKGAQAVVAAVQLAKECTALPIAIFKGAAKNVGSKALAQLEKMGCPDDVKAASRSLLAYGVGEHAEAEKALAALEGCQAVMPLVQALRAQCANE